jgi:hypothetical protein
MQRQLIITPNGLEQKLSSRPSVRER